MKTTRTPRKFALSCILAAAVVPVNSPGAVTPGGTFGDTAIVIEAGGGESLTAAGGDGLFGPVLTHDFDTGVSVDGSYELNPSAADATQIALSAGRHLVMYDTRFDAPAGGTRAEMLSNLTLAGSPLAIGRSQGYIRRSSNANEAVMSGGGIITVASDNDILTLETRRSDDNSNTPAVIPARAANGTAIQFLKLDDGWDFLSLETSTNQGTIGTTYTDVQYDTVDPNSSLGTAFSFTATSGDITLNEAGVYLLFANTRIEKADTNNTRTNYQQRLTLDGVEVPGSTTTTYLRGEGNGEDTQSGVASLGRILSANAGQVLNVELAMETGGFASTIQGGETALTMIKLPITAKTISLTHSASQEVNNPANTPIVFDTLDRGSSAFSHVAGTSQVTVGGADDYLFFGSVHTLSDNANDNQIRIVPLQGWQIDQAGGQILRGRGAAYNRDNGGARTSGSWGGVVTSLNAGQVIELTSQQLGENRLGATSTVSLQGVSVSSLVLSNDPAVSTNTGLKVLPSSTSTITNSELDTFDNDTLETGLTYTVDTAPSGGSLNHTVNGPIGLGDSFTQDDIDNNRVEFTADATPSVGGFDFTVSDGSTSDTGTFVITVAYPDANVTIIGDGDVTEGATAGWTLTTDLVPAGSNLTVNIAYSGSATDGSDYTGVASVEIPVGLTTADLDVTTIEDGVLEGCEVIIASITGFSGGEVSGINGSPNGAIVHLNDSNSNPTGTEMSQVVVGTGTLPLNDIVVFDPDATYQSSVSTVAAPLFSYNGPGNISIFQDGRAPDDGSFDIDGTGPGLVQGNGFSIEIELAVQAADLTGTTVIWETGGSSNGTAIVLVDGIPHLLMKSGGAPADQPTDDASVVGVFTDLDWTTDDTVVVPLATVPLAVGTPSKIAVIYSNVAAGGANNDVAFSVNGVGNAVVLTNNDSINWVGDQTTHVGISTGTGVGGNTSTAGSPFTAGDIKGLAGGSASVSCLKFWNESTGSVVSSPGTGDQVTVTLAINGYTGLEGELTASSGNGESFSNVTGEWTITGDVASVNAALAAVEFLDGVIPVDPTVILVILEDGNEDGGGSVTGSIIISDTIPEPIYVDDDFAGAPGSAILDADGGAPVSPATMGLNAFASITEALGVVQPTGTVIVNDGDYSSEAVSLTDTVTLRLTGSGGASGGSTVTIASLAAPETPGVDLGAETLVLGGTNATTTVQCGISGAGHLTKVGTGRLVLHNPVTYTGTTTVNDGFLRVGFVNASGFQASLDGDGPIVVNAPGVLEFNTDVDKTQSHGGVISGDGEVRTMGDGTMIFDGANANTFSGRFQLGDGTSSFFNGIDGAKQGFVVVNHNDHLGAGVVHSRGSQLRAGTDGIVIPNDFEIDGGGFRCGGSFDFEIAGDVTNINNSARGYSNVGLDGVDLTISGDIILPTVNSNMNFEGSEGKDNGSWIVTGNITGVANVLLQNNFDNGELTLSGTNTYTGTTTIGGSIVGGTMFLNGTHTGGGNYTVGNSVLAGAGSTSSLVIINANGTIAPGGNGIGTLTVGGLDLNGTLALDVDNTVGAGGTDWDQLSVIGTVDVSTGSLVVTQSATVEGSPNSIVVVSNDAADATAGSFATGVPFTGDFLGSGLEGLVDYEGGDGNDITLVTGTPNAIGAWRLANFGSADNSGDGADLADIRDTDGLINLLEFGFGTDPNSRDNSALALDGSVNGVPRVESDGGGFKGVFVRRKDHGVSGSVEYTTEFSSDLDTWFPGALAPVFVADSTDDPAYEVVEVSYPAFLPNLNVPTYFRVRVTLVP